VTPHTKRGQVVGVVIPAILAPALVMHVQVIACAAGRVLAAVTIPTAFIA
jgi:hypothetical protein